MGQLSEDTENATSVENIKDKHYAEFIERFVSNREV